MNTLGLRHYMPPMLGLSGRVSDGPLQLPTAQLLEWWYAGDGSGVPDDITATGNGQPVTAWADKSTNSYDLTKAGAGTATYRQAVVALNNRGAVEFDGASYMSRNTAGSILGNLIMYNLFIVLVTSNASPEAYYSEGNSGSNNQQVYMGGAIGGAGRANFSHRDDALTDANSSPGATGINDGTAHIFTLRRTFVNAFELRLDGVQIGTDTDAPGVTTINRLTIGALQRAAVAYEATAQIACVAGYTADNYATVEPLLAAHYGVTI